MKILDKYIIKQFVIPFMATFLVVLFVLVMLTLWQSFDKIAGKGLSANIIFQYLGYTALMMTPQALPIGVLLSSIMALGSLSENYEFAAIKSAGISLTRLLKPLTIFMILLSGLNFLFLNYVFPFASFESINLIRNMKKKQPAMALVAGSFNNDIPGFSIKFSEKYGEEKNLLKDVLIYDLRDKKFNNIGITAKYGEIQSTNNSKYMTLILKDGYYFKDIISKKYKTLKKDNMPFINAHFKEHQINFDISNLDDFENDNKIDQVKQMMSLKQLTEKVEKTKKPLVTDLLNTTKRYFNDVKAKKLHKDTIVNTLHETSILENFDDKTKVKILKNAVTNLGYDIKNLNSTKKRLKQKKYVINTYNVEYYGRIALSFSALILFLIGAPLGSIIRKGGFGVPMITAILIYVIYHFVGVLGRSMADTGKISPMLGGWFSTLIMLPLCVYIIKRAIKDKGLFDISTFFQPVGDFFKKFKKEKQEFS